MGAFLMLYLRSRRVPAALATLVATVAAVWLLAGALEDGQTRFQLAVLATAVAVAVTAAGLGGDDVELERTAAIAWLPRRTLHVLAIAGVVAGALGIAQRIDLLVPGELLVRACVGLAGLAALGATVLGAHLAWCPPVVWTVVVATLPIDPETPGAGVWAWVVQPPDTTAATVTAYVLGAGGTLGYAVFGPRRA